MTASRTNVLAWGESLPPGTVTREVFENFSTGEEILFYGMTVFATVVFLYYMRRRIMKYSRGRLAYRLKVPMNRLVKRSVEIGTNSTVAKRDPLAGLAHLAIFWGFIILLIGTAILTVDYDIIRKIFGPEKSFFKGTFYRIYSVILDVFGVAFIGGLLIMGMRRKLMKPKKLDYTRAEKPEGGYSRAQFVKGDWLFLGVLLLIGVTGFLQEGFRIYVNNMPDFEVWSPVGWFMAKSLTSMDFSHALAEDLRYSIWWLHAGAALLFVAYIPISKAMHMLLDVGNLIFSDPLSARNLPPVIQGSPPGYRELNDLTWKELLDLDSCTKCGRCHVACPANAAGQPLSPRDLILDLRQFADTGELRPVLDWEERPTRTGPLAGIPGEDTNQLPILAGGVIKKETLWACTTCMACMEACPVGIEHVPTIIQMRRTLVDAGDMEQSLVDALSNIAQQGNSFGKSSRMRARWTKGLDFEIPDARKQAVKYLWFVGDYASFDERIQGISRSLATILRNSGVDFGILYDGERNAGNDVRRVGEEGLFEMLVEHNVASLKEAQFETIFTTDPHSLNTLSNEYPEYGANYPVRHYTQLLAELIERGEIKTRKLGYKVTYHDPCYLARYNQVTSAPRWILAALGCELVEMPRNGSNTFCCGAGGGRIWMDDSAQVERPSENRIKEAVGVKADYFIVACPKDYTMYSDAAKTTGHDQTLKVMDITQLVEEALVEPPRPMAEAAAGVGAEES